MSCVVPNSVCSSLQHLLKHVLGDKIGVCAREIELVQVASGKPALETKANVAIDDRFKLKIPISDLLMTWEVVFNCSYPNCPPDFDLNDLDFFCNITTDSIEPLLPSLNSWDHREDKSLINLISELRSAYLKYQVERLQSVDNRCVYEYTGLLESLQTGGLNSDAVEVLIENNTVHLTIKLDVELPPNFSNPDDYVIALAVRWSAHSRTANLISSPNVTQIIGTNFELPRNINYDESLAEYTEEVRKSIEKQIFSVFERRQKKRREYLFQLLKVKGPSIIRYDVLEYKHCTFLAEKEGFMCLVELTLKDMFPSVPPCYRLVSVYSTSEKNKPLSLILTKIPFSESWDTPTMVEQALNILDKNVQAFRDFTVPLFKLPK